MAMRVGGGQTLAQRLQLTELTTPFAGWLGTDPPSLVEVLGKQTKKKRVSGLLASLRLLSFAVYELETTIILFVGLSEAQLMQ